MNAHPVRATLLRETLHFTAGTAIGLALLFLPRTPMLITLGVLAALSIIFEASRFVSPLLNRWFLTNFSLVARREEENKVTGTTYFLIASFAVALAFPKPIAVAAILFLALGDPIASVVGKWKGKTRLWGKSLEGHLACLVVCLIIGLVLWQTIPGLSLTMAIAGVVAATVFQAFNLPLNDNLTITLGSAIVMRIVSLIWV